MPSQKRPTTSSSAQKTSPYSSKKPSPAPPERSTQGQKPKSSARPSGSSAGKSAGKSTTRPSKQTLQRSASQPSSFRPRPQPARPSEAQFPRSLENTSSLPVPYAMVTRRASETLRSGHLWVYASDIEQVQLGKDEAPTLIPVVDNRGIPLGTALYSPISQIALRMVSHDLLTQPQWLALLTKRIQTAIARRIPLLDKDTNACRLVFSEADELPGLIVDKYAGIVVLQLLAKGLDTAETRQACAQTIAKALAATDPELTLWERPDPRIRELEGLSAPSAEALFSSSVPQTSSVFRLNGLSFQFDVNSGQKTGAFLDQRQNYAAAEAWAKARNAKKALDVCTYQGGFALHLARVCSQVTGIDASRASLEVAERNLALNQQNAGTPSLASETCASEVDWVEADAFEILRAWSESPESKDNPGWDIIVLDPPAFAKSKRAVEGALRGYKELNLRALKMITPGGLLITCSCSHHVTWSDLESAVAAAAVDANRRVTLLERRGAAHDHPVLLHLPETEYLKCLICQID